MGGLIVSLFGIAIEAWERLYFFDTFLKKKTERIGKCRYWILLLMIAINVRINRGVGINMFDPLLVIPMFMIFCMLFYHIQWKQGLFFSGLNYCLVSLMDFLMLQMGNIWILQDFMNDRWYVSKLLLLVLVEKIALLSMLFIFRKVWKRKSDYGELSNKEWLNLSMIPLFTVISVMLMYFGYSGEKKVQMVYLFLAVGLTMINFLVMGLMQDILAKGELLRENALTDQKRESQLAHYQDMQAVYERQGRKLHDYKNQIRTIQVLLKEGDTQSAAELAERLTESISVEMAAVNTNHPVVNAVLNQKFHAAREQGVSMIFRVGDMSGMRLDGEETVILLSNLLDNAIHECVKVVRKGRKAVINIKLVQEGGRLSQFSADRGIGEQGFYFGMGDVDMGKVASSVSIICGADGPTSIFIAGKGGKVKFITQIQNYSTK